MSHYDCKECHQDPVSGHAPDCQRGKAMDELIAGDADLYDVPLVQSLTEKSVRAAEMAILYRRGGCGLDADILRMFSEAMGQAADYIASARIKGDKGRENPAERPHDYERGKADAIAAIVKWLRGQKTYWPSDIADAIEAGEPWK